MIIWDWFDDCIIKDLLFNEVGGVQEYLWLKKLGLNKNQVYHCEEDFAG